MKSILTAALIFISCIAFAQTNNSSDAKQQALELSGPGDAIASPLPASSLTWEQQAKALVTELDINGSTFTLSNNSGCEVIFKNSGDTMVISNSIELKTIIIDGSIYKIANGEIVPISRKRDPNKFSSVSNPGGWQKNVKSINSKPKLKQ